MSPATVPGLVDAAARSSRPLTSDADPSNRPINGSPIAVLDLFAGAQLGWSYVPLVVLENHRTADHRLPFAPHPWKALQVAPP